MLCEALERDGLLGHHVELRRQERTAHERTDLIARSDALERFDERTREGPHRTRWHRSRHVNVFKLADIERDA